jgi:hypothetical protein
MSRGVKILIGIVGTLLLVFLIGAVLFTLLFAPLRSTGAETGAEIINSSEDVGLPNPAAEFLMAYLTTLVLSWIYLLGVALLQHAPLATILYGLPSIALILAGRNGINLAFGVRGVNLVWTDPRKMEDGWPGSWEQSPASYTNSPLCCCSLGRHSVCACLESRRGPACSPACWPGAPSRCCAPS